MDYFILRWIGVIKERDVDGICVEVEVLLLYRVNDIELRSQDVDLFLFMLTKFQLLIL